MALNAKEAEDKSPGDAEPISDLRIACLEPSATAICLELGLADYIVGVTHECDPILKYFYSAHKGDGGNGNNGSMSVLANDWPLVLTKSGLTVDSQADIHLAIQKTAAAAALAASNTTCPIRKKGDDDTMMSPPSTDIPSTYPLIEERMQSARPNVIFTQDLCDVCAPTTADVRRCLLKTSKIDENSESSVQESIVSVISLQPTTLHEVTDTFVTIAEACGVPELGKRLKDDFLKNLKGLREAIHTNRKNNHDAKTIPTMFILEWLDPVFDSGHWTCKFEACCFKVRKKISKTEMLTLYG